MKHNFRDDVPGPNPAAGARRPANFFCIHSYAGEAGPPCGWRGTSKEISCDAKSGVRRCPRCGRATLMEIPVLD